MPSLSPAPSHSFFCHSLLLLSPAAPGVGEALELLDSVGDSSSSSRQVLLLCLVSLGIPGQSGSREGEPACYCCCHCPQPNPAPSAAWLEQGRSSSGVFSASKEARDGGRGRGEGGGGKGCSSEHGGEERGGGRGGFLPELGT